jgi:hypothetical protein
VKLKQKRKNKLISNEELEFDDLEDIEEDFHGAFRADPSDARDWLNKDEEDFGCQNLIEEEIAQQLKRTVQAKTLRKMERKKKHVKFKFSEVEQNLNIISFVSDQQYNKYYLMLREVKQDVVKE